MSKTSGKCLKDFIQKKVFHWATGRICGLRNNFSAIPSEKSQENAQLKI